MAVPAPVAFAEFDVAVPDRHWFDLELAGLILGLFVLIATGAVVALRSRSWTKPDVAAPPPEHSLAHYQDLLEQGLLDRAEFERIRARMQPPAPPSGP
jgi:hypothetical protein